LVRGLAVADQRDRSPLVSPGAPSGLAGRRDRGPPVAPKARGQRVQTAAVSMPFARVASKPKQFLIPAGLGLILGATMLLRLVVSVGAALLSLLGRPMLYLVEASDSSGSGPGPLARLAGGAVALWSLSRIMRSLSKLFVLAVHFVGSQHRIVLVVLVPIAWVAVKRAID